MKLGIETHQWGFYRVKDDVLIATCIAKTYYEATTYFEDVELVLDQSYIIKIIHKLTS